MTTAPLPASAPPPPPSPPSTPSPPTSAAGSRPTALRRDSVLVALGIAFLAAAIVISAVNSRRDGDLDWSNYAVGIAATVALLIVAVAGRLLVRDPGAAANLVSWPAAFGAVGAGLMVGIALDDADATLYVSGVVILVVAAAGYLFAPSAPPVLAAVLGLVAVYGQTLDDTVDVDDDNGFVVGAVAIFAFVAVVTVVSWFLRAARIVVAVTVGAFAVVSYLALMASIAFTALFFGFSSFEEPGSPPAPDYDNDVYVIFGLGVVLILVWLAAGVLTDHPGFKVLMVAMAASVLPAGLAILAVEHPSWWGLGAGVFGGLVLAAVGLGSLRGRRTPPPPAGPPAPPPYTG